MSFTSKAIPQEPHSLSKEHSPGTVAIVFQNTFVVFGRATELCKTKSLKNKQSKMWPTKRM